jgi:hypothetical protein
VSGIADGAYRRVTLGAGPARLPSLSERLAPSSCTDGQ